MRILIKTMLIGFAGVLILCLGFANIFAQDMSVPFSYFRALCMDGDFSMVNQISKIMDTDKLDIYINERDTEAFPPLRTTEEILEEMLLQRNMCRTSV